MMALGVLKAKMAALQERVDESEKKADSWKYRAEEEKRLRERSQTELADLKEQLERLERELELTKAKLASALPMLPEMERRRIEGEPL